MIIKIFVSRLLCHIIIGIHVPPCSRVTNRADESQVVFPRDIEYKIVLSRKNIKTMVFRIIWCLSLFFLQSVLTYCQYFKSLVRIYSTQHGAPTYCRYFQKAYKNSSLDEKRSHQCFFYIIVTDLLMVYKEHMVVYSVFKSAT